MDLQLKLLQVLLLNRFLKMIKMHMIKKIILFLFVSKILYASPVFVNCGGTGKTSMTAYAVICGGTSSDTVGDLQNIASLGTSGQILTSTGSSSLPTFQAVTTYEYAHIYDTLGSTITAGNAILFDATGLKSSGITYTAVSGSITINTTGVYLFNYYAKVTAASAGDFLSLTVNASTVTGSQFTLGGTAASNFLMGNCIRSITAGDVVKVVNCSGATSMVLDNTSSSVSASITIVQIT
jgi:hypothetical protein